VRGKRLRSALVAAQIGFLHLLSVPLGNNPHIEGETGDHIMPATRVGEGISNVISSEVENDRVRFLIIGCQLERSA